MERALAEYVVNALWQLPLLAAGAWVLLRLVRPGPRVQHGTWLAILALAVLLPGWGLRKTSGDPKQATVAVTPSSPVLQEGPVPFFMRSHVLTLNATVTRWLVRIYLASLALALLRIASAWHCAQALVANSRPSSRHQPDLKELSLQFDVRAPQLRESARVSSPMVVGFVAPVVLLPEGFHRFREEEVRAALCHELAHIQRQDYLTNLVCQVAALPLAWHPVVHALQRRIRMTREMVCDAMAAEEMKSHLGYAKCLLALANSMLGERTVKGEAEFVGLFSRNTLEERVMRLMDKRTMSMRARVVRGATGAAMMIATGSLAAMFHVTPMMAEQATTTPPPQESPSVAAKPAMPLVHPPILSGHAARHKRVKRQVEETRKERATILLNDEEFRQRMEDAQRQIAKANATLDSPEFKQRMEEAQRQIDEATQVLRSADFRKQMEDAQRQMADARTALDDAAFKKRMEEAQRQAEKAAEVFRSPAFKKQIEELARKAAADAARTR